LEELEEAVANYAVRAARKIRREGSLACGMQTFLMTNRFREDLPQYANAKTLAFDEPTDDVARILASAKRLLRSIFRPDFQYKKAGVLLLDLIPARQRQTLLFPAPGAEKRRRLLQAMDEVAAACGPSAAFFAAQGIRRSWSMKRQNRTPRYTTHWEEIPEVG